MVSENCIISYSELNHSTEVRVNDINNANDDVGDLIGEQCFDELCAALSSAIESANTWNSENETTKTLLDYLDTKWKLIITNRHFKKWYSNRVAYHWFEGSSITQLKKVGLITTSNEDDEFKNGFKHAEENQRKRLSNNASIYASNSKNKFLTHFWSHCASNYSCRPDCPCDDNISSENPGSSIGFSVLN